MGGERGLAPRISEIGEIGEIQGASILRHDRDYDAWKRAPSVWCRVAVFHHFQFVCFEPGSVSRFWSCDLSPVAAFGFGRELEV